MNSPSHRYMRSQRLRVWVCSWFLLLGGGCALSGNRASWRPAEFAAPSYGAPGDPFLAAAERHYAAGVASESQLSADCVDQYFLAAASAWPVLQQELVVAGGTSQRTAELYHSAVAKMLINAQQFGRWSPCRGIDVVTPAGPGIVQVSHEGFPWGPHEFQMLEPVGEYRAPNLSHLYRSSGVGVPLVVVRNTRQPQPFTQPRQAFAATVVFRPLGDQDGYVLNFHDPLRVGCTSVAGRQVSLARDISAPFALGTDEANQQWLANFIRPGANGSSDGLFMIEPYQPGKIPVVFVHGLLSDPATWVGMANELRARRDLNDHFQWCAFRYATGEPFLASAAVLRRQLAELRGTYDPNRSDPAFSQMVLIGHSLGGLVAKLQVTGSGDQLWQAAFRQSLTSVHTTRDIRERLLESFYFHPSRDVTRVVFIGTPHLGSSWASRPVGRLGSLLVEASPEQQRRHAQLLRDNPTLFRPELEDRFPTSVDLLEPDSQLLLATARLPFSPTVSLNSIVGNRRKNLRGEPTDGVVPVYSARLIGVSSELIVDAKHEVLHTASPSEAEVLRVLREHLAITSCALADVDKRSRRRTANLPR